MNITPSVSFSRPQARLLPAMNPSGLHKGTAPQFSAFGRSDWSNRFSAFNILHKGIFVMVVGIFGLSIASQFIPGLSGIPTAAPTNQNTVGTVAPNMGLSVSVTDNQEVINSFGAKVGSFDAEGKAFDGWGSIVGYGTDSGFVYKLSSSGKEKLIGEIDANGQFKGQYMQNGVNFNLPGLTRAQRAAVAAIVLSAN